MLCSPADVRRITNEWIARQGGKSEQLSGIIDILDQVSVYFEGLNEVINEGMGYSPRRHGINDSIFNKRG
jgi:hypothetical protein